MKLIFTSFGLSHFSSEDRGPRIRRAYHESTHGIDSSKIFHRMPPLRMSLTDRRPLPDYAALLLANEVLIDNESWDRLSHDGWQNPWYEETFEILRGLQAEGLLQIVDFASIVRNNRQLLKQMLERDLRALDLWVAPLKESLECWRRYVASIHVVLTEGHDIRRSLPLSEGGPYDHPISAKYPLHERYMLLDEALQSARKRRLAEYRRPLKQALEEYLSYVNATLVISRVLGAGFHDWADYEPFYREKFLSVGKTVRAETSRIEALRKLFEISFPEFRISDPKRFLKIVRDKRIAELRSLVSKSISEGVEFDKEFGCRTLHEVLRLERRTAKVRTISSWITLPIGWIPTVGTLAQKGIEESVVHGLEHRRRKDFQWFYLISETKTENKDQ